MSDPSEDLLVSSRGVRRRYDDCSHMWIVRRLADDPLFPKPIIIARRRFWRLSELVAWERSKAVAA
jgi:hypothetical protein